MCIRKIHLHHDRYNNILYCHYQSDTTMITGSYDATLQVWDFSRGDVQPIVADVD